MSVAWMVPKITVANWLENSVQIRPIKFSNGNGLCWNICRQNSFHWKVVQSHINFFENTKRVPIIEYQKWGLKVEKVGQCYTFLNKGEICLWKSNGNRLRFPWPKNTSPRVTRRERLKSALYLRLKKRKVFKIVKWESFDFLKIQFVAKYQENWRGDPLETLKKIEKFFEVFEKKQKMRILKQSHSAKKLERETLWAFWNFSLLQNIKKLEGGPFGDKKSKKKSHSAEKKIKSGTL